MRSPSERLIKTLTASGLCSRAEIEQCEPLVRGLCQDLPDFDSVWLDALVQQNSLTPWQAEQLQDSDAARIAIGRFHLSKPLGAHTWLATERASSKFFVLRKVPAAGLAAHANLERRLSELLASLTKSRSNIPAALSIPLECLVTESASVADLHTATEHAAGNAETDDFAPELFLRSEYVSGWSMEELLIRGGRLPFEVVAEIGRELLIGLAWLESTRLLHGDIVLRNVRLDSHGGTHLVDPFLRRLTQPQFAYSSHLTLRDCEGIAPEMIGTGRMADARSELYSLGCVLWQLLTTRPVVLSADPITRLMKQREQDIVDVRTWVPDCPEWMARLIQSMTRRSPELRSASAAEVLQQWRKHSGGGFTSCRKLASEMPDREERSKPRVIHRRSRKGSSWLWPVAAASAMIVLVVLANRSGMIPTTLSLDRFAELTRSDAANQQTPANPVTPIPQGPQPLPAVDADGRIVLQAGVHYIAARRDFAGTMQIACDATPSAVIEVDRRQSWILSAQTIELKGLKIVQAESEAAEPSAQQLLAVQCGTLSLQKCLLQSPAALNEFVGLEWHLLRGHEGVVIAQDSVFAGGGYGLSMNHPPRRFELSNVLLANRGGGVLTEFRKGDAESWDASFRNVTQRFGYSVIDAIVHDDSAPALKVGLTSAECVYEPQAAVIRVKPPQSWRADKIEVAFRSAESGNPAIVPPNIASVIYIDASLGQPVTLPASQVTEDNLLLADLEFDVAEPANTDGSSKKQSPWTASSLRDYDGPKLTNQMPGVDVSKLPNE